VEAVDPLRCAELLADAVMAGLLAGDAMAAVQAAARAEELVADPTANVSLVVKLVRGTAMLHLGQLREGAELLREASALAGRRGPDRPSIDYVILTGAGMSWIGQHTAARDMLTPLVAELRRDGAVGMLPYALYALAYAEARAGRLGIARSTAAEAVDLTLLTGDEFWRYMALSVLSYVLAIRGDEGECRQRVTEALALRRPDTDYPRDATEALGLLELGLGHYDDAVATFRAGGQATQEIPPQAPVEGHPDLLEAYLRSRRAPTESMRALIEGLSGDTHIPLHAAVAWRLRGLIAPDADFADCFHTALQHHAKVDCPLETARTLLAFGERLRRSGQRVQAREQLRAALEIFERLGARNWTKRANDELKATGESRRARAVTSILDELTPQEHQVARLVVTGYSNREVASALFLSTKTVEYHLGNIYRKLGVRSRTELAHRYTDLLDR
jgi:DNA-binding CsgD family transcriptional regulator